MHFCFASLFSHKLQIFHSHITPWLPQCSASATQGYKPIFPLHINFPPYLHCAWQMTIFIFNFLYLLFLFRLFISLVLLSRYYTIIRKLHNRQRRHKVIATPKRDTCRWPVVGEPYLCSINFNENCTRIS